MCVQIGMMSEESLERSHKAVKVLVPKYVTMNNNEERLRATVNQLHLQTHPSIEIYAPPDRPKGKRHRDNRAPSSKSSPRKRAHRDSSPPTPAAAPPARATPANASESAPPTAQRHSLRLRSRPPPAAAAAGAALPAAAAAAPTWEKSANQWLCDDQGSAWSRT